MASDGLTPPAPVRAHWWVDAPWLLLLAAWTAAWCLSAAPRLGVTYDEPFYLDAGLDAWRGWDHDHGKKANPDKGADAADVTGAQKWPRTLRRDNNTFRVFDHHSTATNGVMPLPIDAITLPLYVHERRADKRLENQQEKQELLRRARAVTLGWLWLLVVSGWRLGRAVGGAWAGRIAAGLLATDPNFLGHASVATTDIAVCATLMAFARAVHAGRDGGWWKRLLLPGLWFGVAALCKISALLYGGLILVSFEVCYRFASGAMSRPAGASLTAWGWKLTGAVFRSVVNAATIIVIGVTIAVVYFGFPEAEKHPFVVVAKTIPPGEPLKPRYDTWAENSEGTPHAVCAFAFQWWYNSRGRPSYLNGTFYPESYRYYFPEILLMKVPLPIFALALIAIPRVRAVANPLTLVTFLLLATLLTAKLQIGVRLALPAVAIGYAAVAVTLGRGYPRCAPWFGLIAILALVGTSAWVWPHGLGYLNQAHGGMQAAAWRVSDSNVDWGHGLPDLKKWHLANGEPPISVWYFGTDPAVDKPPFRKFVPEDARAADGQKVEVTNAAQMRLAIGPRVLAVGHTVVSLHPNGSPAKSVALEYLHTRRPLARTATFTLYDFRDEADGPPPREEK